MIRLAKLLAMVALLWLAVMLVASPGALRVAWTLVEGRSVACPMANALGAPLHVRRLTETKDRILAASRLLKTDEAAGIELWDTPDGPYWIPIGTQYTLPFNLAEQELGIYSAGEVRVRPGDVVLDCGANVGVYVRAALNDGARTVVAIEPLAVNLECLRRNFPDEIADGRVILYPKGVWDRTDLLTLRVEPENTAAASFLMGTDDWEEIQRIPVTTIDRVVRELGLPTVDFIKMDIEGAEQNALYGAKNTLATFLPRLAISAYHQPDDPAMIPIAVHAAEPDYQMICGPCAEAGDRLRPDVLLFWMPGRRPVDTRRKMSTGRHSSHSAILVPN